MKDNKENYLFIVKKYLLIAFEIKKKQSFLKEKFRELIIRNIKYLI